MDVEEKKSFSYYQEDISSHIEESRDTSTMKFKSTTTPTHPNNQFGKPHLEESPKEKQTIVVDYNEKAKNILTEVAEPSHEESEHHPDLKSEKYKSEK